MSQITVCSNTQRRNEKLEIQAHDTSIEDIENLIEICDGRFRLWEGVGKQMSYISLQIPDFMPSHKMSMTIFSPHTEYKTLQPLARRATRLGWDVEDCTRGQ